MKRILVLVMSCQNQFFIDEEQAVKDTWAKQIIDGKYLNIDFIIYRGGYDKNSFSKSEHLLKLNVEDDLEHTFKKTYFAFSMIKKFFGDYDYIFRTNTSTYVNVELLNAYVNSIRNDDIIYTSDIYSLTEIFAPYPMCLIARGNGMILSNKIINALLKESLPLLSYTNLYDDHGIGNIINSLHIKNGENYKDFIKEYRHGWYKCTNTTIENGHPLCKYDNDCLDFDFWKSFMTIQMRNYGDLRNFKCRENEIEKIYEFHSKVFEDKTIDNIEECVSMNVDFKEQTVFIGSLLNYIPLEKWESLDKYELYDLEVNNKASDDKEFYKDKQKFIYIDYHFNDSSKIII